MVTDAAAFLEHDRGGFDLVTCVGFLHHLQADQLAHMFGLIRKALSPGGVLVLAEPVITSAAEPALLRWWNRHYRERSQNYDVAADDPEEAPLQLETLHDALKKGGLRRIGEGRGWEIFPRGIRGERFAIGVLHALFGATGPVYWVCCKSDASGT